MREPDGSPASAMAGEILSKILARGIIMLADGPAGNILAFTPPFQIKLGEIIFIVSTLKELIENYKK